MRLAERRGCFTGDLSLVQNFALELTMVLDAHRDAKRSADDWNENVKYALLTANPRMMKELWPEIFTKDIKTDADAEEVMSEEGPVQFVFDDTVRPEDVDRLFATALAQPQGDLGQEIDDDDDEGWQ